MHIVRQILLICCLALFLSVSAQGVRGPYSILSTPETARLTALGGSNVSVNDGEISLALQNPALLSEKTDKNVQLAYRFLGRGLNGGSVMYGHNFGSKNLSLTRGGSKGAGSTDSIKPNRIAVGLRFFDYGRMTYADEVGQTFGTFTAKDFVIDLIYSRQLGEMFSVGVSLMPIYSVYEAYTSFALGANVGGMFQTRDKSFHLGLSLQNIGWQLKSFYSDNAIQHREDLPLNLVLGLDYKLTHAPLRFSVTMHHLQQWDLGFNAMGEKSRIVTFREKNEIKNSGTTNWENAQQTGAVLWTDMLFRHVVFAVELVPKSERFYLTLSYNHRQHAEMTIGEGLSLSGLSLGAGLRLKQFALSAAVGQYTKGNITFGITLTTHINEFIK